MQRLVLALALGLCMTQLAWAGQDKEDVNKESAQSSTLSTEKIYALQERCATYTAKKMKEGFPEGGPERAVQTNHYNRKLNKCFVLLHRRGDTYETVELWDILEEKEYGTMQLDKPFGVKFINGNFLGESCMSQHEWESRVKPYMEE